MLARIVSGGRQAPKHRDDLEACELEVADLGPTGELVASAAQMVEPRVGTPDVEVNPNAAPLDVAWAFAISALAFAQPTCANHSTR
jgi:hypothetical protein